MAIRGPRKVSKERRMALERENLLSLNAEKIIEATREENPKLAELMDLIGDYRDAQDVLEGHFDVSLGRTGAGKDKIRIKSIMPTKFGEGAGTPEIISLYLSGMKDKLGVDSFVAPNNRKPSAYDLNMQRIYRDLFSEQAKKDLGSRGLRAPEPGEPGPPIEVIRERGNRFFMDMNRGYNPVTAAPYGNQLDAGHIQPHAQFHELSADPDNLRVEDRLVNTIQLDELDPQVRSQNLLHGIVKVIRNMPSEGKGYSPQAIAEMAAGPEIMRISGEGDQSGRTFRANRRLAKAQATRDRREMGGDPNRTIFTIANPFGFNDMNFDEQGVAQDLRNINPHAFVL